MFGWVRRGELVLAMTGVAGAGRPGADNRPGRVSDRRCRAS